MPDQPDHAGRAVRPGDVAVGTGAQRRDFTYVSDATAADLAKAGDLLGYRPAVDLEEGVRRQWEWLAAWENPAALAMAEAVR